MSTHPPGPITADAKYLSERAPGSTPFEETEEAEPLSFAPARLRRESTPSGGLDEAPPSRRVPMHAQVAIFPPSERGSTPPSTGRRSSLLPPPGSARPPSMHPPASRRSISIVPPSSSPPPASHSDVEAISSRFGNLSRVGYAEPSGDSAWFNIHSAVEHTSAELRRRAFLGQDAGERARFIAHADSLDKLLATPLAAHYMLQSGVASGLDAQLRKLRATQRAWPDETEYQDILLKAAVTSIHLAPCLGYWQSADAVPKSIKNMLTRERVYGTVLEIAKARKSREVDQFIGKYTAVVGELARTPALNLKVRGSAIWPWCRFAIDQVAYTFRSPTEKANDVKLEEACSDVKLLQVLFNVFLDDAADNVQDPALVRVLGDIPTAGGSFGVAPRAVYAALRGRLREIGRPEFEAYFDLAVEVWIHTLDRLRELTGPAFTALERRLARDYARIVDSCLLSVDLNARPVDTFRLRSDELQRRYGSTDFGEILAHNSNRMGFYTVDLMVMRAQDEERYVRLRDFDSFPVYEQLAALFQEMHQIGNSVATGAREVESDDVSNELFKIANDWLNTSADWAFPEALAELGPARNDVFIRAFQRKKETRQRRASARDRAEREAAHEEYTRLSDGIEALIEATDSEERYFADWLSRRGRVAALVSNTDIPDGATLIAGNDLLLVMHLIYKGKI